MIYQERYDELMSVCRQITSHKQKLAKPRIEELIVKHIDINISNENLLSHLVAESFLKRIDKKLLDSKNIYIQQFDIPQIVMFYSMAEAVPFVFAGHSLANQFLGKAISNLKTVSLMDIGIGKGLQCQSFIERLAEKTDSIETINIIGVDPDKNNLENSKANLENLKDRLPFMVNYYQINKLIEDFTDRDYDTVKEIGGKNIVVNSSFTFHHTAHPLNNTETRTELLEKVADLKPLVFNLIEPNSNHDTEELTRRFHNSWDHFGTVFKLIDESNIEPSHKFSIKEKFFGREIRDIFGVSDYFRCERHELYDSWLLRLFKAGFKPVKSLDLEVTLPDYCSYSISEGLVRLDYDDTTVVAVMSYSL